MEVDFCLPSEHVIHTIKQIIGWRGKPLAIRCDNGPEYLSAAIVEWASASGIRLDYIQPGKPQQNAHVERFKRTARYGGSNLEVRRAYVEILAQIDPLEAQMVRKIYALPSERIRHAGVVTSNLTDQVGVTTQEKHVATWRTFEMKPRMSALPVCSRIRLSDKRCVILIFRI